MPRSPNIRRVRVGTCNDDAHDRLEHHNAHDNEGNKNDRGSSRRTSRKSGRSQKAEGHHQNPRKGSFGLSRRAEIIGKKTCRGAKENINNEDDDIMNMDKAIENAILYMLLVHHKKLPVKRSEIVKHALNSQGKYFPTVIEKVKEALLEIFGIEVVNVEQPCGTRATSSTSYIMVSRYPMSAADLDFTKSLEADTKQTILFLILTFSFMLRRSVEEERIWKCFEPMLVGSGLVRAKEELRRFLKQEFISTLYLREEEVKQSEKSVFRYSWGLRSEKEFSKQAILKFVAKEQTGMSLKELGKEYNLEAETEGEPEDEDGANMNRDDEDMEIEDTADVSDVSEEEAEID